MKKIFLAIMAVTIGASSMAQSTDSSMLKHKDFSKGGKHWNKNDINKLNLTNDQKAQMKTANDNFRQQMQTLNKNTNLTSEELKDKRVKLMKEHKDKMNAILTPAQREQAQNSMHKYGGHKGIKGEERFEEMTKDLNLTPAQSVKMKELNTDLRNKIQSIHQDTTLSKEEKREQMKSLMKQHKNDMETLLTNEQKEQLKNNHKNKQREVVK